jgi:hypothetical protein
MFKTIIAEKYVPVESQILSINTKGESVLIKEDDNNELISQINPNFRIIF